MVPYGKNVCEKKKRNVVSSRRCTHHCTEANSRRGDGRPGLKSRTKFLNSEPVYCRIHNITFDIFTSESNVIITRTVGAHSMVISGSVKKE